MILKNLDEVECCEEACVHCEDVCLVRRNMPAEEVTGDAADFFKAFADLLGMTQSAISHQLRFLKQSRLVKNRKDGKTVYYSLNDDHISSILAQGLEHIQEG